MPREKPDGWESFIIQMKFEPEDWVARQALLYAGLQFCRLPPEERDEAIEGLLFLIFPEERFDAKDLGAGGPAYKE